MGGAVSPPQLGLGQSPSGNRILCILALKSDIWWQQIYYFYENQLITLCQEYGKILGPAKFVDLATIWGPVPLTQR